MSNQSQQSVISIQNCNNIEDGQIVLEHEKLNIKYGLNGTGKSTLAKAIQCSIEANSKGLESLRPFKHRTESSSILPSVTGLDNFSSVKIFNTQYVEQFVYQPDELLKNSFEVFIKNEEYTMLAHEIEEMIASVVDTFKNNENLNEIIDTYKEFLNGCGKSSSSIAKSGAIHKGFADGNKIDNIPNELLPYKPYIQLKDGGQNVKWINWQTSGHTFLDVAETCPFCTTEIYNNKQMIQKVAEEFDPKIIEHLAKILRVFETLSSYFSDETNKKIKEISSNARAMLPEQNDFLFEVKQQVSTLVNKLESLKYLTHDKIRKIDKIKDFIQAHKINLDYFLHLKSAIVEEKILLVNTALNELETKASVLQGKINKHKSKIIKTIDEHHTNINTYLKNAGYNYSVCIDDSSGDGYKIKIKHNDFSDTIPNAEQHLSFGERNAFALVMFLYDALRDQSELIVFDDPLSSFDGNKQFAILNMLFMGNISFKNRTVLVLTHSFNFVIDCIYNLHKQLSIKASAHFLWTYSGKLEEKSITHEDIKPIAKILEKNKEESICDLCKCVYLRRFYEVASFYELPYQLLSNLFKKRDTPYKQGHNGSADVDMTEDEIAEATGIIQMHIIDFDYYSLLQIAKSDIDMINLYHACDNNYEKLHLYRIIFLQDSTNRIAKKFINETFHIENDFLFQLNPRQYEIVPQFIIDECNADIADLESKLMTNGS